MAHTVVTPLVVESMFRTCTMSMVAIRFLLIFWWVVVDTMW